ncbi:MAG: M20/M25/M40 family metallo-hydrolase, partial [Anaerolineae bacterium]|nr:M20/M25/M40 family metallo-hydrolase [Anaerolineae bacterium]
ILIKTIVFGKVNDAPAPAALAEVPGELVAEHLAVAIRHRTISDPDRDKFDYQPFVDLRKSLEKMYPRVHATLRVDVVNKASLFYTWRGKDETLAPILLASHSDVVPVDPASRDEWRFPPFDGKIAEGCVWGRGALDNKNTLIAMLDAVETLIKNGYQPQRSIILAIGHDEEVSGHQGAAQMAGRIQSYNTRLAAVLDEGGAVFTGQVVPGLALPVALLGTSEKGYLTLHLEVEGAGGHAAFPPKRTAIGVLARAIQRLEENPLRPQTHLMEEMFRALGAFLPFGLRMAFANFWLFKPLVIRSLSQKPRTSAMVRTTTAATLISGGIKDNVLPGRASAAVNFRLMPGDRVADVVSHVRETIRDEAVQIHIPENSAWEASPVSSTKAPAYAELLQVVQQVFPEALPAPYLVQGATDSRYYTPVCDQVFRFSPMIVDEELLESVHNKNERIPIDTLARMVQFYIQLIKTWAAE